MSAIDGARRAVTRPRIVLVLLFLLGVLIMSMAMTYVERGNAAQDRRADQIEQSQANFRQALNNIISTQRQDEQRWAYIAGRLGIPYPTPTAIPSPTATLQP